VYTSKAPHLLLLLLLYAVDLSPGRVLCSVTDGVECFLSAGWCDGGDDGGDGGDDGNG
jgi:hypothetical protein